MKQNYPIYKLFLIAICSATLQWATASEPQVVEFVPAPGQFINVLPSCSDSDNAATAIAKAQTLLNQHGVISLGSWGGYITLYVPDGIVNLDNEYDFRVLGNAFTNNSEPGVIYVSTDNNHNGIPDDTWYEIAGSEDSDSQTIHDYHITYYHPSIEKENQSGVVNDYISWRDSNGTTGYVIKNQFHQQSYWPLWMAQDSITFSGTRLPNNATDVNGDGSYIAFRTFDFGYADNYANNLDGSKIKIEWAVDENRDPVTLDTIHFVKVMTAVQNTYSNTGEISTEVSGLEVYGSTTAVNETTQPNTAILFYDNQIYLNLTKPSTLCVWNLTGCPVSQERYMNGEHIIPLHSLPQGVYIIQITDSTHSESYKIIKTSN